MRKSDGVRVYHEKKMAGVRVNHERKSNGVTFMRKKAMG